MPSDDKMSIDERRKYLKLVAPRYTEIGRALELKQRSLDTPSRCL